MLNQLKISLLGLLGLSLFGGCLTTETTYSKIAPGTWRGVLELEKVDFPKRDAKNKEIVLLVREQFQEGELPFNFNVVYTDETRFYIEIQNGTERIRLDSISWGRDRTRAMDTMRVYFPEYQSFIHADLRGDLMAGEWVVTSKDNYRIPFRAKASQYFRFTTLQEKPALDLSGEWAAAFGIETEKTTPAIGEFKQNGNHLEGTFRTESGDYRFLEGTIQGSHFWLSCFDGSHAFLFSGKADKDSLFAEFRSGIHHRELLAAWRDPNFKLKNADSLAAINPANPDIRFSFQNPDNQTVAYPSSRFENKIKIFTVSGTWCPNCRDEQVFLRDFMKNNPNIASQTEVVVLSFERKLEPAMAHLREYKRKLDLPFEVVLAGKSGGDAVKKTLPFLSGETAFPTMVILDKSGKVRRVHTGFDGPATSKFKEFEESFLKLMNDLSK